MEKSATFSIESLKTYREGKRLEVKSAKGGLPNSLWETYSAFANSDGGVIVLGVKVREDGSLLIEGLKDVHKLLKDFWNMVNNRQKVSSNILTDSMVKIEECESKYVIVIRVPRAERTTKPVYVGCDPRSGSYRRNGEGDYHCFEGHQPDTEAMRRLYDDPETITFGDPGTPENEGNAPNSKIESVTEAQSKGESKGESTVKAVSKGESKGERVVSLLKSKGELTLPEVARILNLSLGGIEKIVRQLKRDGILVREGSTKAGRWVVKD